MILRIYTVMEGILYLTTVLPSAIVHGYKISISCNKLNLHASHNEKNFTSEHLQAENRPQLCAYLIDWRAHALTHLRLLKESVTRFSTSGFFHKSVSPKPLSIHLGPFRCLQVHFKVSAAWYVAAEVIDTDGKFAAGVVDTGGALWLAIISAIWKNSKRS